MKRFVQTWVLGRRRRWVFFYLGLLLASTLVRVLISSNREVPEGWFTADLRVAEDDGSPAIPVRIAYQEYGPPAGEDVPVLVMVHGTRASAATVGHLARYLKDDFRLIIPDLPGFGESPRNTFGYSAEAQSRVLLALLQHLGIEKADLLGFSLGGVVVVEAGYRAQDRVRSMILVSSVGTQEYDLFGDRMINHSLYTLQWMFLSGLQTVIPHFGLMDAVPFNRHFAAFLRDTDLRSVRWMMEAFPGPVLILHGLEDGLVPPEAAEEHARLMPQSELVEMNGGHGLIYKHPAAVAEQVRLFIEGVESGAAPGRAGADPARLQAVAETAGIRERRTLSGWQLVPATVGLALATLISEDLTCIAAGLLVSQKVLPFWAATAGCLIGIVVGDILLLLLGRAMRRMAWESSIIRFFVRPEAIIHGERWIEQKGPIVALVSRFTPGTRLATYLAAGLLGVSIFRFSLYFVAAASLWTPMLVALSASFGAVMMDFWSGYQHYALTALILFGLLLFGLFKLGIPLLTHRGRRLLLSRWKRLTRWEFWPPWIFYPPIVLHIIRLGLKHRSLSLFTAVNPAMPHSGVLGESKSEILDGLAGAGASVARWRLLPASVNTKRRFSELRAFMQEESLEFPVVVKPDVGQRGSGVKIVRSSEQALAALAADTGSQIVQEYIEGPEFGLFYARRPSELRGRIISITEKRRLWLEGDGNRTVEELILDDDRAVCMARFHLKNQASHLDEIPARGARFPLVEVGSHCRGSLFLDGARMGTPELSHAVDAIARTYSGFYFGRFDVRADSEAAFLSGRGLKILELNGITSEVTHIYDPSNSLWSAYRDLAAQWTEAFEIGRENRALGFEPTPIRELARLVVDTWLRGPGTGTDKARGRDGHRSAASPLSGGSSSEKP